MEEKVAIFSSAMSQNQMRCSDTTLTMYIIQNANKFYVIKEMDGL
jgi:hypothetical protein